MSWSWLADILPLIAVVLSARLAMSGFYSQKWWERKADAYSRIMEELSLLQVDADDTLQSQVVGYTQEREVAALQAARLAISKATAAGAFVISPEAAKVLQDLESRLAQLDGVEEDDTFDPVKDLFDRRNAIFVAVRQFREAAEADLRPSVRPRW